MVVPAAAADNRRVLISRRHAMNTDILQGNWKQLRGRVKEMWGNLTDDDLDKIDGHTDRLAGLLQERYGYAKDKAEAEIRRFTADTSWTAGQKKTGNA
jgi:uncharacterized protein YjbJ (UPF0337 family)